MIGCAVQGNGKGREHAVMELLTLVIKDGGDFDIVQRNVEKDAAIAAMLSGQHCDGTDLEHVPHALWLLALDAMDISDRAAQPVTAANAADAFAEDTLLVAAPQSMPRGALIDAVDRSLALMAEEVGCDFTNQDAEI